ncbi:MAG: efflux RND transporter permease subunit [Deltaproteobacteria bacterium]|nr:efflux RND transporter permease subunit [Deltaproteobacteria bacterium]
MNLAAVAIEKRAVTYFTVFLVFAAGVAAFFSLGQLEDPEFTIKTAVVITSYPGASPKEVELEVTDRIELALQEMKQLDFLESFSRAGLSLIKVNIKPSYKSPEMPQIWDELRRKIRDVESSLPPGVGRPDVGDDFGDVFGHIIAVTGDGFTYAELERYVKILKKELSLVEGVARVDLWGVQKKIIYLDVSQTQLSQVGLSDSSIEQTLAQQNLVVDAGHVDVQNRRLRIAPTGAFGSPDDIANLVIRPSLIDSLQNPSTGQTGLRSSELIRIRDIGTIRRGYREPPTTLMRYNGEPAIALAITNVAGVNIVEMGRAIDARLKKLVGQFPIGIEVHRVHWQSDVVAEAVNGFLVNFAEALLIVLVVLTIGMGWRLAFIIGVALVATILGSFLLMAVFGIDLQRMSLGALIIALGMMVDNAIVVADGFVIRLQRGMDRIKAAVEAASSPSMPLLGATVIAVMAFYPIYSSDESAGEYCASLFSVVAISLLVSWVISVTLTPLQCVDILPDPKGDSTADPYAGGFFGTFRRVLEKAVRFRFLTIASMVGLLVLSGIGFGNVKKLFFPDSSMTKFMVDYWAPQGTRIQQTSAALKRIEDRVRADKRVESVSTFVGAGPPRFYLPVEPENPYESYGQLIINVKQFREIDNLVSELEPWVTENFPEAQIPIRKFGVGPSNTWKFDVRITGPGDADPGILRALAAKVTAILDDAPLAGLYRTDWRQRVQKVVPIYSEERGRWAGVSREDIASATKQAFDGRVVGLYREGDDLTPIVMRQIEEERQNVGGLDVLQVKPTGATHTVPLSQVTKNVVTEWEDPLIWRRDRRRTIKIQANPIAGVTLPTLMKSIASKVEATELPAGYVMEWGGEIESSAKSQKSLIPGVIPAIVIVAFVVVALFNAFRPPLVIALTIPFAMIGVTAGLLVTGAPFGFVALLAGMSLVGMMIKNAIVLLDEVNVNLAAGKSPYDAVIEAALSRVRPVGLAAATTVLGMIPLLQDVFWIGLAVTIMAGLTFGTVLTMVLVPVLYSTLYRIPSPAPAKSS